MSEPVKHECGIALLRLLKPLNFYKEKYGTSFYALNKMYLLMEKQHNRGQDGAGIANIKFDVAPGKRYISRYRSASTRAIRDIFEYIQGKFLNLMERYPEAAQDPLWLKDNYGFSGELWLGHLRYGTFGGNKIENCHPFLRQNNWMTRNLVLAGNFNLTNVDELFDLLVSIGQHPKERSDTVTVLEKIGHFIDEETELLYQHFKSEGVSKEEATRRIAKEMDVAEILRKSANDWDGGYVMAGLLGHGDAFVLRDPNGIRPAWYYSDDEIAVVTSERPPIKTAFNVKIGDIKELQPGHALIIKKNGQIREEEVCTPGEKKSCSFERIYFSRGNDMDIYNERKQLGLSLCDTVLDAVDYDLEHSVISFIPNTAETAFLGLVKGLETYLNGIKADLIVKEGAHRNPERLKQIMAMSPRVEKVALKDIKLRTFITEDTQRDELVTHVYDITHGTVTPGVDHLVVIDDSIVRGTTLKNSILHILSRLAPKDILVVSSAPQIRYPDCYGIDMAKLGDFIAFRAAVSLLEKTGREDLIQKVGDKARQQLSLPKEQMVNVVKEIYTPFSVAEINQEIAILLTADDPGVPVRILYQSIEGLHKACPDHMGDWYFTGDYPTPGGNKVVNRAFVNYIDRKNVRAY